MNNNIIEIILNKDKNTNYQCDFDEINNEYIITVKKAVTPKYCPVCNTKMYSKGIRTRRVRHPILNNGKTILIHLKQHSWVCTNQMYKHRTTGTFSLVEKYNHHFKIDVDTYFLEKKFFEINDILPSIKKLKEKYIDFNSKKYDDLSEVESKLDYLIEVYKLSEINIFIEFAALLERYKENIINSFVVIEKINSNGVVYKSRLSNGPIEATNRKIKDLKRHSRGFNSFTHIRNRFLFSENENSTIRNCPLKMKDIRRPPGKKRGKYKRRNI